MTATEFSARQDLGLSNFGALWASRNVGTRDVGKDAISGVIPGSGAAPATETSKRLRCYSANAIRTPNAM